LDGRLRVLSRHSVSPGSDAVVQPLFPQDADYPVPPTEPINGSRFTSGDSAICFYSGELCVDKTGVGR